MKNATAYPQTALNVTLSFSSRDQWTDEMLIQSAVDGDAQAFGVLFERYQQQFLRLARGFVKSDADAQDVVQSAFLNMFRKLYTFQLGSCYRSWAYRVVVNTALMRLRKKKHRQEVDYDAVEPQQRQPTTHDNVVAVSPDEHVERTQLRALINEMVETLPEKYKVVFVMRESEDLSLQEIGDALDLSVPAVKSRLHRARLFLRASLERHMDDYGYAVEAA